MNVHSFYMGLGMMSSLNLKNSPTCYSCKINLISITYRYIAVQEIFFRIEISAIQIEESFILLSGYSRRECIAV